MWPRGPLAVTYITLGWVAEAAMPQLAAAIGIAGLGLLGLGGLLYAAGERCRCPGRSAIARPSAGRRDVVSKVGRVPVDRL